MIKQTVKILKELITKPFGIFNELAITYFPEDAIQIQLKDMDAKMDSISKEQVKYDNLMTNLVNQIENETDEELIKELKEYKKEIEQLVIGLHNELVEVKKETVSMKTKIMKLQTKRKILLIKKQKQDVKNKQFKKDLGIEDKQTSIYDTLNSSINKIENRIKQYDVKFNA